MNISASIKYYIAALIFLPLLIKGIGTEFGPFDSDRLCRSCHSMAPFAEEYMKSTHYHGRTGVKTRCVDCHTSGGLLSVDGVMLLGRDLFYEVYRPIRSKEEIEARRPAFAKKVREGLVETGSRLCIRCHPEDGMLPAKDRGKKAHEEMKRTRETCIDCHYNLVHDRTPWEGKGKKPEDGMLDL